ncbi:MAG TPA: M12 family metallo-peptidase [Sphingobacteriaceae bacterium]|nr:M12 family metallo-peptidase [Sphingobacteriaceae bacterium]
MTNSSKPSQEGNVIHQKIQQTKASGTKFIRVSSIFKLVSEEKNRSEYFLNPNEVSFIEYDPLVTAEQLGEAILLTIPLRTGQFELELRHVPDSFYDYTVTTSDGKQTPANKEIRHYRGIIKDDPNSLVAISFFQSEVMGLIANKDGNFNLSFDKQLGVHLLFNDRNLKQKMDFQCGTKSEGLIHYDPNVLFRSSRSSLDIIGGCIRLYFETEYDIYQYMGSKTNVESLVTGIFNQVAILYTNENIGVLLSDIYVWEIPDPYTATTAAGLLEDFIEERTSFVGDLGQLLTFRNLGANSGMAKKVGGLCNSEVKNKLSVARIINNYEPFPAPSWSVFIVAHEFGHSLGSEHTHDCVWNGNNTAIDGCKTPVGCSNPGLPPPNGGTIMSYCIDVTGIGIYLGFGPQPGNVIRNFVANAACIKPVIAGPDHICVSGVYSIADLPSGATVTDWSADPSALVSISGSGTSVTVSKIGPYKPDPQPVTLYATLSSTPCGNVVAERQVSIGTINPNITDINISGGPGHEGYFCEHALGFNSYELVLNPSGPTAGPFVLELLSYPGGAVLYSQEVNLATGSLPFTAGVGTYTLRARGLHPCGPDDWKSVLVQFVDCNEPESPM